MPSSILDQYRIRYSRRQWQDILPDLYPELETNDILVKNITFVITENCNLRCTYCYECNKDYHAVMSEETARAAVDMILDGEKCSGYTDAPFLILEFIGGEPFLQVKLMDYIVEYMRYKAFEIGHPWYNHYMISISTNGTLWFNKDVQAFLQKYRDRLSVSITIDGDSALHDACRIFPDGSGSHSIVEKAIKDAVANYNMSDTKVTLAPENIQYIGQSIPYLFSLGLTNINANVVFEDVWKPEDARLFYQELVKLGDWIIDNEIYKIGYVSLFDESIGQPMDETENDNWCFRAGTLITTPYGNKPIEQLQIGDEVVSYNDIHKIEKISKRKANNTLILKANGIIPTYTTKDHPYLVKRDGKKDWELAQNLKPKDKIAIYRHKFGNIHSNSAYILGRYIGNGWHSEDGYQLCGKRSEVKKISAELDKLGIKYKVSYYKSNAQFAFDTNILELAHEKGQLKNIPAIAFQFDEESVQALIDGIIEAGGTEYPSNDIRRFTTINAALANDVLYMLHGLGYMPICYHTHQYDIYYDKKKTTEDIIWTTVISIEDADPYDVYNLTVEDEHNYIANGCIVHNCGGNGRMLAIGTDGKLFPCIRFMKYSLQNNRQEYQIGDIEHGIDLSNQYLQELNQLTRRSQSTDECFYCPVASGCAWCTGYNYDVFGTPNKRATFICMLHKARVLANYYFWNKLYKAVGEESTYKLNLDQQDIDFIEGKV